MLPNGPHCPYLCAKRLKNNKMENNDQQLNLSGNSKGVLFGFLLMLGGALLLAFNFGWLNTDLRYVLFSWPMIFVVFAFIAISKKEFLGMLFWLVLAAFFLLPRIAHVYPDALPGVDGNFARTYWPVLLIIMGLAVVVRVVFRKQWSPFHKERITINKIEGGDGFYERKVVFGGHEDIFLEPVFRGGQIEAVFGGVEIDLRRTTLPEGDTHLQINAVFGGIKIYLPNDWLVISKVDTVLGGVENKRFAKQLHSEYSQRLIISGEVIFGGCEIL